MSFIQSPRARAQPPGKPLLARRPGRDAFPAPGGRSRSGAQRKAAGASPNEAGNFGGKERLVKDARSHPPPRGVPTTPHFLGLP